MYFFKKPITIPMNIDYIGRGGGVTTIYAGTGYAIFGVPFFEQKIDFGVSLLVKSREVMNLGVSYFL